jgi:ribosomal protein L11 methyltransferase
MEWVELALPAGAIADEIAAILVDISPAFADGAWVRGEDIVLYAPAADADRVAAEVTRAAQHLADSGLPVDPAALRRSVAPPESEWRDAWKRYFHVRRFGQRLVIVPSWERDAYDPQPGDVVLDLDPGRAFGTGAHASTQLCLLELEALHGDGHQVARFADIGTGSGILSVAAAKLWPSAEGVATDVDPIAVSAARENLDQNGVGARVRVGDDPPEGLGRFDLVVANIQADILLALRDQLIGCLAPGATLILSGILHDQADTVGKKYAQAGLTLVGTRQTDTDKDWTSVRLARPR